MQATDWLALPVGERRLLVASAPLIRPDFLQIVQAPEGWGVYASAGPNFRHAIFGRDSIETAIDLCMLDRLLARDVILGMARMQGVTVNEHTEEEPGKIYHEYRALQFGNVTTPKASVDIMRRLQAMWGATGDDAMVYYGTYDATPLYIRLVREFAANHGEDFLDERYIDRLGAERTFRHSVLLAADWLAGKLKQREDHLLAYKRMNPQGLENQVWKDSRTSYLFSDGSLPNLDAGVVSIELQGYAYDALLFVAKIEPSRAAEYLKLAADIQKNTIAKLWMPQERFFAQGLGVDASGTERQIDTLTSNAGLLLDSRLLADLPEDSMGAYVDGVVAMLMSPEFRTEAGIRCRALRHAGIPGFADYHGTYAVWPKETFDIAQGMAHFGYKNEARELYKDIVWSVQRSGEFYEFFYVEPNGNVWYDAHAAMQHFAKLNHGHDLPVPEPGQAWTISAAIMSSHIIGQVSDPTAPTRASKNEQTDTELKHEEIAGH
jgi:glycogen debranching enzyme